IRPALRGGHHCGRRAGERRVRARDRRPGRGAVEARPAAARGHGARGAMLSLSGEPHSPTTRRPPRSLKQEYHEFLLQRIEEYKNTLGREELLEIGDEAVRELEASAAGQYLLTEVLLLEHVDRIIARRLRLLSFPRWRQKHRELLAALRARTRPGGVHVILPSPSATEVIPLAPEALQAQYGGWEIVRRRRTKAGAGFTATKPERQLDTAIHVSE